MAAVKPPQVSTKPTANTVSLHSKFEFLSLLLLSFSVVAVAPSFSVSTAVLLTHRQPGNKAQDYIIFVLIYFCFFTIACA